MRPSVLLSALLLLPGLGRADTIILKTGEKLEGRILSETPAEVTMEVQVTPTIKDPRTLTRGEIQSLQKSSPDEEAYKAIATLQPGPNSLPPASYEAVLGALQGFVTQYPTSPHAAEVSQRLATFAEEKGRVEKGELHLGGRWLSKDEVQRERYQISAQVLFAQMGDLLRRNDLLGALNSFALLEKSYPGSASFPEAVEMAKGILPQVRVGTERTLQLYRQRKAEREQGLKMASTLEQPRLQAAQAAEDRRNDALLANAQRTGQKWGPLLPGSEKSILAVQNTLASETPRLTSLQTAPLRKSLEAARRARGLLEAKNPTGARDAFREATSLWPANELAQRGLKEAEAAVAAATPTPPPATPTPAPTPGAGRAPGAGGPGAPAASATPVPLAPAAEERGFVGSLPFYGLILLVALGGGYFALRARQKAREEQEPGA